MPLAPDDFRRAMGALAAGVCVVTVREPGGELSGLTATSVSSLSLEPPLLLACIGHESVLHDLIVAAPAFGVLMLAASQEALAARFATRGRQRFDAGTPLTPAGLPAPAGIVAAVDCRRAATFEGGDHTIVAGSLEWAATHPGAPLLHFRGRYTSLA